MSPQKPVVGITSVGSQRDNRFLDTVYDQHKSSRFANGRPFWGTREHPAEKGKLAGFCDLLSPGDHNDPDGSNWSAPWLPEQIGSVAGGNVYEFQYQRNRVTIRYDKIIGTDTQALTRYYDASAKITYEKGWPLVEYGKLPPHAVVAIIGTPPRSPKIAQAAQAGDPWILGYTDEVNEELAELLGLSRRGFIRPESSLSAPALTTPERVLSVTPGELQQMIAEGIQTALAAEAQARREKMATVRAGKGAKAAKVA